MNDIPFPRFNLALPKWMQKLKAMMPCYCKNHGTMITMSLVFFKTFFWTSPFDYSYSFMPVLFTAYIYNYNMLYIYICMYIHACMHIYIPIYTYIYIYINIYKGIPKIGGLQHVWYILENLMKKDDLGVPPISGNSHMYIHIYIYISNRIFIQPWKLIPPMNSACLTAAVSGRSARHFLLANRSV